MKMSDSDLRRLTRRRLLRGALCTGLSLGACGWAIAQDGPNSSLYSGQFPVMSQQAPGKAGAVPQQPLGWYEVPLPPPKEVRIHDIISIRVDMGSRVSTSAQLQNRRTAQYDARLNDWIFLEGLRAVKPAPQSDGDQRVQGNLTNLNRVTGQLDTTENLKFEIAATVAAVLPNGNIVLEAHESVRVNDEQWMQSLSGVCRREDIGPGNVVLSKDIANLKVDKRDFGQIRDTYKRGWLTRLWDQFTPF
ncbi:MAG TPA: flagellar basal body L-ring protein FlgH [Pirellulaceae bacterium]|nr:flagellar basal body L-ring protein FlgH [Pirellulaceae bacterium]